MKRPRKKHRRRNLDLELNCHACGHRFVQPVGWRVPYVYCPVCNSREVHVYSPPKKKEETANSKILPFRLPVVQELILLAK